MRQNRCIYCNAPADEETANGDPICDDCIRTRGFSVCTVCGKFSQFVNYEAKCPNCENKEDN